MLRTTVSASSAYDPDGWDESPDAQYRKAMRLIAMMPAIIASYHRLRTGQAVVEADPKLGHAANFLWMLLGNRPDDEAIRAMNLSFVLYADHTMNASTFTARIIASTLADMFSAITGAIGCLKGPLHGGANEESMKMLEEVDKPENAEAYVRDRLERKEKIFGFGHAVYTTTDPRARIFKEWSRRVGESRGDPKWFEISEAIERTTFEQKGLYPNVDFYAASVYHVLGIPTDLMTPIFTLARMVGWTAHVREQYADNRVIRPDSAYIGPAERSFVPLDER
jgi:citrate synthase